MKSRLVDRWRVTLPLCLVMLVATIAAGSLTAGAQSPQLVLSADVENRYPSSLAFTLDIDAPATVSDVTLHYSVIGRGSSAVGRPDLEEPAASLSVEVEVPTNTGASFIPVGSEFVYYWQVTLEDGSVSVGEEGTFLYLPPGADWELVENDFMEVYYHGDRAGIAAGYLSAAEETYSHIGDLLNVELTSLPVRVIVFAGGDEMRLARPGRGETFDAAVVTCGSRVADDIVFVIPLACGTADHTDTLRHEFAHILTAEAGETALVKIPAWLDEGTAVLAQASPGDGYVQAFNAAVRQDDLIPFIQMNAAPGNPSLVNLFYGQSFAMVTYLLDREGQEAFAQLFALARSGNGYTAALEEIYGLDLREFEDAFRESYGLAPRHGDSPSTAPTPADRQDPLPGPTPVAPAQSTGGSSGVSSSTLGIIGLSVLFALVAVLFYLVSLMLQGRRVAPGPGRPSPGSRDSELRRGDSDDDTDRRWRPPP